MDPSSVWEWGLLVMWLGCGVLKKPPALPCSHQPNVLGIPLAGGMSRVRAGGAGLTSPGLLGSGLLFCDPLRVVWALR